MDILVGVIVGIIVALAGIFTGYQLRLRKEKPVGVLRVDTSDPDGPYLFLELHTGVGDVMEQKQVTLEVSTQNYISHE